jgi:hypothetical protein
MLHRSCTAGLTETSVRASNDIIAAVRVPLLQPPIFHPSAAAEKPTASLVRVSSISALLPHYARYLIDMDGVKDTFALREWCQERSKCIPGTFGCEDGMHDLNIASVICYISLRT